MTCCISQFYVLSPRGDKLVFKDYRHDVVKNSDEIFSRIYKFYGQKESVIGAAGSEAPPFFNCEGVNYAAVKRNNLIFVLATRTNVSPSLAAEIVLRIINLFKDYIAVLSEDSMRKNFSLVYELLDEAIDHGYIQETNSDRLRPLIFTDPIAVEDAAKTLKGPSFFDKVIEKIPVGQNVAVGSATPKQSNKSVFDKRGNNEIYVDILERISCTMTGQSTQCLVTVEGQVTLKSFLAGNPLIKMSLNEDLQIGKNNRYGSVHLDDCNFHECVNYEQFESDKLLILNPPDGEFTVMNYRTTSTEFLLPFRIETYVDTVTPYKLEVTIRLRCQLPSSVHATGTTLRFNVPKNATTVNMELGVGAVDQTNEYIQSERAVVWGIRKFNGGIEHMFKARIQLSSPAHSAIRKDIGPVSLAFEVPNHNTSGLTVRNLRIEERSKSYNPTRWVRSICQSGSYVSRIS